MAKHKTPEEKLAGLDPQEIAAMAFDSPDAPTALMIGAFIETFLEMAIDLRLERRLLPADYAELFSGYGPLATFSSKIALGYAMKAVEAEERNDLKIIKNIRNECAHSFKEFSFGDDAIIKQTNNLKLINPPSPQFLAGNPMAAAKWAKVDYDSSRGLFVISFFNVFNMIMARSKIFGGRRQVDLLKLKN